jgi:hypothetical protein
MKPNGYDQIDNVNRIYSDAIASITETIRKTKLLIEKVATEVLIEKVAKEDSSMSDIEIDGKMYCVPKLAEQIYSKITEEGAQPTGVIQKNQFSTLNQIFYAIFIISRPPTSHVIYQPSSNPLMEKIQKYCEKSMPIVIAAQNVSKAKEDYHSDRDGLRLSAMTMGCH